MNYCSIGKKPNELKAFVGNMSQIARIRQSTLNDGKGRGVRIADFNNGSGLTFTAVPDRGMDIHEASYKGIPLAWISPVGYCHPSYYEKDGLGWLRTWHGGMVTGCGLRNVGVPDEENGEIYGLHGRLSHIPAANCVYSEKWLDDQYVLSVTGEMNEVSMYGENLLLTRTISTAMGDNRITIEDCVENQGYRPSQYMLLYHINVGYPIVNENSVITAVEHPVVPRDSEAEKGLGCWHKCQKPTPGYSEQCFYHDIPADDSGMSRISIENRELGLAFEVAYEKTQLPNLTQWKQMGQGEYVIGLEPGNCHPEGVNAERKKYNSLRVLQPGESATTHVEMNIREF